MTTAGTTICLCMIVKDEAEILPRCLESCRDLIDHWVICDTGSTDGTQEVIRRELAGVPGELHERPWLNFGANRSELMGLAQGTADYLLLLDADMAIDQREPIESLTADSYLLREISTAAPEAEARERRLVRGDRSWRYAGWAHERLEGGERAERLDAIVVTHHVDDASAARKLERDLELLTGQLQADPDDGSALFSLAQVCRDLGRLTGNRHLLTSAADRYQRRADMPGPDEEAHVAQHQAGVLAAELGDWPGAMDACMRAWELRPQRLEALYTLTSGLRERGQHQAAHRFARVAASRRPLPVPDDLLEVDRWVYEWGMLFEYSITSYWVGDYRSSIAAGKRLLNVASLPGGHRGQAIENLKHALREQARVQRERTASQRKIKHTGTPTRGFAS